MVLSDRLLLVISGPDGIKNQVYYLAQGIPLHIPRIGKSRVPDQEIPPTPVMIHKQVHGRHGKNYLCLILKNFTIRGQAVRNE